jgi:hypothetical protein
VGRELAIRSDELDVELDVAELAEALIEWTNGTIGSLYAAGGDALEIKLGIYRHYKGHDYQVIGCATHTESGEEFVVYRALYGVHQLWVRPKAMFVSNVTVEGRQVPRFRYIGDQYADVWTPGET